MFHTERHTVHIYTHTHTYINFYTYTQMYIYIYIHTHTYVNSTYICTYMLKVGLHVRVNFKFNYVYLVETQRPQELRV